MLEVVCLKSPEVGDIMRKTIVICVCLLLCSLSSGCTEVADVDPTQPETIPAKPEVDMSEAPQSYNELNEREAYVILKKGTEPPNVGEYTDTMDEGIYLCRQCNARLYKSEHKFHSDCGWPAFDNEIEGAVKRQPDADGRRVEILCANCDGHLGHVFEDEGLTERNIRHCVNSLSMRFYPAGTEIPKPIVLRD